MIKSIFTVDKSEDSPGFLLWQVTMIWQRIIKKALENYGISHAQFVILAILLWFEETNQEITQISIVQQSKLDKMTVSKALKGLVALKLIKRSECTKDTRAKTVKLTSKGKSITSECVQIIEKIDAEFFGTINKKDQKLLLAIFAQLKR